MELLTITLRKLRNEEHYQFMRSFDRLLTGLDLVEMKAAPLYASFKANLTAEGVAIERLRGLEISKKIALENMMRYGLFRTIALRIKSNLTKGTEASLLASAKTVDQYLRLYGNLSKRLMSEKDASHANFIRDLQEKCSVEVAALDLTAKVESLKQLTNKIDALMDERLAQVGKLKVTRSMAQSRSMVDVSYQVLKKHLAAYFELDKTSDFDGFKEAFNALVLFHKQMLIHRKPRKDATTDLSEGKETIAVS